MSKKEILFRLKTGLHYWNMLDYVLVFGSATRLVRSGATSLRTASEMLSSCFHLFVFKVA